MSINTVIVIVFAIIITFFTNVELQNPMMKKPSGIDRYLATKTPYRVIANKDITPPKFTGCRPTKIWMIIRHGTRYPSKKYVDGMINKLPKIKEYILKNGFNFTSQEVQKLKNWSPGVTESDEKKLTHEGEDEMIELAERMQKRFPSLLTAIYSNTSYKFRFTATQRTEASARSFATGLFGRATSNHVWYPEPVKKDPVLRFYKLCEKWRKEVKKNINAVIERKIFIEGSHMHNILKELSKKLGLTVTFDDAHLMYMSCAFETAWHKYKMSPWCSIFSEEAFKTMEYSEDLQYYWIDGYGYNLTYRHACPAVKNLVNFFKSLFSREETYPKAVLYFTHSGTLLKLLAHLGLYKDEVPLRHDNFISNEDRLWRVGKIDAFGTNLAFILYDCGDLKKMLVLHQEKPIRLPGCLDSDLCDFKKFLYHFNDSINNCNFDEMCHV